MSHPTTTFLPHPELASTLSDPEAAALSKLSNASQVWAWTPRTVATYEKYISTLYAIQNSVTPINNLAPEILQMDFASVQSPEETSWRDPAWMLSLQSVCRRWRSVLLATPEYWAEGVGCVIDLLDDPDSPPIPGPDGEDVRVNVLRLFLARSAPCPLEVRVAYPSCAGFRAGWQAFEGHYDRVVVFEVTAGDEGELRDILCTVATGMKCLERLTLETMDFDISTKSLDRWDPHNLPRLGHLGLSGHLFCRATTLPSLHTVDLTGRRYIESLPTLLPALEGCPALTTLSLHLATNSRTRRGNKRQTPERIASLPNLCYLDVIGTSSEIYRFLSFLSFLSTTHVNLTVVGLHLVADPLSVLPNTLPLSHSGLYTSPHIDRLYLYSGTQHWNYSRTSCLSIRLYVQGNERLHVTPAFPFTYARDDDLLRFMGAFRACTLTELALNLEPYSPIGDGDPYTFWERFFAALPHLRRLELLSPTVIPRERDSPQRMNRAIVQEFLEATKARHGTSLTWVLRAFKGYPSYLEEELSDVEDILDGDNVDVSERLGRLELYIMTGAEHTYSYEHRSEPIDLTRTTTDRTASRLVTRAYVSRLEKAVDVVFIGGGGGFAEDDETRDLDDDCGHEDACSDTDEREE
ncbi:hypothetical protein V8D89_004362 [Ganoderma adspersum]